MRKYKELPKGWIVKQLGSVVFYQKGKLPKSFSEEPKEGFLSYVDINAFENASVRRYANVNNAVITSENDVLVVWDGSRFGFSGIVNWPPTLRQNRVEFKVVTCSCFMQPIAAAV